MVVKNTYCSLLFFFLINCLFAQDKIKEKAFKSYDQNSFHDAIYHFEKLENPDLDSKRKLGESYYNIKDYVKAELVYAEIIKSPQSLPSDIYRYASLLNVNQKYMESEIYMVYYNKHVKNDTRANEFFSDKSHVWGILNNKNDVTVKNLMLNSENQDFGATYYRNKIIFTSSKQKTSLVKRVSNWNDLPFLDLYIADLGVDGELNNIKSVNGAKNKKLHEASASISPDGQVMFFTRNDYDSTSADGTSKLKLFYGKFNDGKLTNIIPFKFNNNQYSVGQPSFGADNNTIYFVSDMPGGMGGTDIYSSQKVDGVWSKPVNLGKTINSEGNEMFPYYRKSILFFSSNGHTGLGGLDIFYSNKQNTKWGKVHNLGIPHNSSKDDFAFVTDSSFTTGYFSSNREGGKGDDDLYFYRINKPFIQNSIHVNLFIFDIQTASHLSNASVKVLNSLDKVVKDATTEDDGLVSFEGDYRKGYSISVTHPSYMDKSLSIVNLKDDLNDSIYLTNKNLELQGKVLDSKTKKPIEGAQIAINSTESGNSYIFKTDSSGTFLQNLGEYKIGNQSTYSVEISKQGYIPITLIKSYKTTGKYALSLQDSLSTPLLLNKIEVGQDLGKVLNLKPIYFDAEKSSIRKDAALELDKIVKILNESKTMKIELGSHTDCHGSAPSNKIFSEKRAKALVAYIQKSISNPSRIIGKGYGEGKLKNNCSCEGKITSTCDDISHQENRRTEFIILEN